MVDSQNTGGRSDFLSSETDELGTPTDSSFLNAKDTTSLTTSIIYNFLDKEISLFCQKYNLEKPQIVLGAFLLFLLCLFLFFISSSWAYYRPIIHNFHLKEELTRRHSDKKKDD